MRIKLDENLPGELASTLKILGHDIHTVKEEGIIGHSDDDIWEAAQHEERCQITQDLDFSDVRRFIPGEHSGIILVRLHSPSRRRLLERVLEFFKSEDVDSWSRCFVVATDRKVRVRRPKRA